MSCACGKDTCGCEGVQIVHLADECGAAHEFYISDYVRAAGRKYAFLVSTSDAEQYALLRVELDTSGKEYLVNIEDEQEWNDIQRELFQMEV